jgi:starvation-inducible DNA-binding protein
MPIIRSPLDEKARQSTGETLQRTLTDLIDLGLLAKQAHWNLTGPGFTSLHLQLDAVADTAREHSDMVAERAVTIGVNPDGRASTVSAMSRLPGLPEGYLGDRQVVQAFCDLLAVAVTGLREAVQLTGESDPVSQDVLIGATAAIEKHYWMFQAQQ